MAGVDIGASKISFVLLEGLKVLRTQKVPTPKSKKEIIRIIEETIKDIAGENFSKISGIGIGIAGPVNKSRDLILNPPNLVSFRNCPLPKILEKDLRIKTELDNDANCFALAEAKMGAGRGAEIVFGVTVGSGIGGGLVIGGNIYRGAFGAAGEIGHMAIKFDGLKCSCGSLGCFEEYASQKFIKRKTKTASEELSELAEQGNKGAQKIWQELGRNIGIGLANIINILDPEVIVVGGGISNVGELILKPAREEIKKRVLSSASKKYVKIKKAKLGDLAGAIGAGLLSIYEKSSHL